MRASATSTMAALLVAVIAPVAAARAEEDPSSRYVSAQAYFHALRAELLIARGEDAAAAEALQLALVYDPESYHLTLWLARLAWKIGRGARVERLVERAMKLEPKRAGPWLLRGEIEKSRERIESAEQAFERAAALEPASTDGISAALALAEIASDRGQHDRAVNILQRAFTRAPNGRTLAATLAEQLLRRGDLDEAIAVLEKLGDRKTSIDLYERAGRWEDAALAWRDRVAAAPEDVEVLLGAARADLFARDFARAIRTFDDVLQRAPRQAARIAKLLLAADRPNEAAARLEPALRSARDSNELKLLFATALERSGALDRALALLEEVPPRDPAFDAALEARARIVAVLGHDPLPMVQKAGKKRRKARILEAELLARRGREKEALSLLGSEAEAEAEAETEAAAQLEACTGDLAAAIARLERFPDTLLAQAQLHARVGSAVRAERLAEAALSKDPKNHKALALLARLRASRGKRLAEIDRLLVQAILQSPDDAELTAARGRVLLALGKKDLGRRLLDRAAKLDPDDPLIQEYLGDATIDPSVSKAAYARAAKLYGEHAERCSPGAAERARRVEKKRSK